MNRIHYAWVICLGCSLMMFCSNGIIFNIYSVFQPYLIRAFALSNTQSSFLTTVRSVSSLIAVSLCVLYYRVFRLRTGMFLAGLCSAGGFFLFAAARNYAYLLAGAVSCGMGYGLGTTIPIAMMIGRWFDKSRNFAMSLCSIAASAALVGFPSMVTVLIEARGIGFSFFVTGIGAAAISVAGFLLLRNDPADLGLRPYGKESSVDGAPDMSGEKRTVAVNKRFHNEQGLYLSDWILVGGAVLLMGIAANTGYAHLSVLFSSQGLKPEAIAIALSVYGLCLLGGKLIYGFLSDRIGSYLCNWLYGFLMITGYTGLCLTGSFPYFLFPAVAAAGAGMAVSVVGTVAWAWDLSRESRHDQTIQRFQLIMNAGGLSFNIVPGIIADRCNGSYIPAFIILTFFCILLVIMIQTEYIKKGASGRSMPYKR